MSFLREYDISDEVIEKIKENNDKSIIHNMICDNINVGKVINYFKDIKIEVINELLIKRPEIFSINYKDIVEEFKKYNIEILVTLINEDINAINFI